MNVGADYVASKTYAYGAMDNDYFGNPLQNDGTALPGPFQNLKLGSNQISLWSGLPPLDIYIKPIFPLINGLKHVEVSNHLTVYSYDAQRKIVLEYKSNHHLSALTLSLYSISGNLLYTKFFDEASDSYFKTAIDASSYANGLYIVRFTDGRDIYSRKIQLNK